MEASPRSNRFLCALALIAVAVVPISVATSIVAPQGAAVGAPAGATLIEVRSDRVSPSGITTAMEAGGSAVWTNLSGEEVVISSPDGVIDSGPVAAEGEFRAALPVAGSYPWSATASGRVIGSGVVVVAADFVAAPDARADEGIPDVEPPITSIDDFKVHPERGDLVSTSMVIVGFTDDATVADARAALGNNWNIVGGYPEFRMLFVEYPSALGRIDRLVGGVEQLRLSDAIEFVVYDDVVQDVTIPAPSIDAAATDTFWDSPDVTSIGAGQNWGLELSRLPQAWNLSDQIRRTGGQDRAAAIVVDGGFEAHEDLSRMVRHRLCITSPIGPTRTGQCSSVAAGSHGNSVLGTLAADHNDRGVSGVDPFSRPIAIEGKFNGDLVGEGAYPLTHQVRALREIQRDIRRGVLTDIHAINMSWRNGPAWLPAGQWWDKVGDETCGPGPDDDDGATGICYPDNHDATIAEYVLSGKAWRFLYEGFVRELPNPPLFVVPTGNDSQRYCAAQTVQLQCDIGTGQPVTRAGGMQWPARNWDTSVGPNPIIVVESIGEVTRVKQEKDGEPSLAVAGLVRSSYSNLGGDVSAPGNLVAPTTSDSDCPRLGGDLPKTPDGYCFTLGTSIASPFVAGVAGVLRAWDPTLSAAQVRQQLTTWAIADTTDGAAPRIDAYGSLVSLPGAAAALADMNDASSDGNRRVEYTAPNSPVDDTTWSATAGRETWFSDPGPDVVVDMRDFRRLRDAWLQRCEMSPEAGCPGTVALDGSPTHPKRDLNGDGCVNLSLPAPNQQCPSELTFPRADLNGDGTLSINALATVPLRVDGSPAANQSDASQMTDVDVMASQWSTGTPGTTGYLPEDLNALMLSGDITFDVSGLIPTGDTAATVRVIDDDSDAQFLSVDLAIGQDRPVLTLPTAERFRLEVEADGPTGRCVETIGPFRLDPGEDRFEFLGTTLNASIDPDQIRPGASATATVRMTSCEGVVEGTTVRLSVDPELVDGASVASPTAVIGADGTATVTINGGELRSSYSLIVDADVPVNAVDVVALINQTGFGVGEAYELEVAASDETGSDFTSLHEFGDAQAVFGPSINGEGSVAFGALTGADLASGVFVSEPDDLPTSLPDVDDVSWEAFSVRDGNRGNLRGNPEINDLGQVIFESTRTTGVQATTTSIHLVDGMAEAPVVATATNDLLAGPVTPYWTLGWSSIANDGGFAHRATDDSNREFLVTVRNGITETSPVPPAARPRLADDGTVVLTGVTVRPCADFPAAPCPVGGQLFDDIVAVGQDFSAPVSTLAEGRVDGWGKLSAADISPAGGAVAFVADRNDATGLFVSVRHDGGWTPAVAVEGPAADGQLASIEHERPSIIQIERAPAGPEGDRLFVAVQGADTGALAPAAEGILVVPITVERGLNGSFDLVSEQPRLVAQVGDIIDGFTIDAVAIEDSLANAVDGQFVGDHWVAFTAFATDETVLHVRGRSVEPLVVNGEQLENQERRQRRQSNSPRQRVTPEQADAAADVDVITAVTVSSIGPAAGEEFTIFNRSRTVDGDAVELVIDAGQGPVVIGADSSLTMAFDQRGIETIRAAAPVEQSTGGTDVSFTIRVTSGPNLPPTVVVADEVVAPLGAGVVIEVEANDAEGGQLRFEWDLDGDGVADVSDEFGLPLDLSAADAAQLLCGGTCASGQLVPVALTVFDDVGGHVVTAATVVRFSDAADFALDAVPDLIRIEPGTSLPVYVDIEAIGGFATPVAFEVVDVPDGWSVGSFATFEPVRPGETARFDVRPAAGTDVAQAVIGIIGRANGIERRVDVTVTTVFGLIPRCSAQIDVTVLDPAGLPVPDVRVRAGMNQTTGPAGTTTHVVELREGYEVDETEVSASRRDWLDADRQTVRFRCDDVITVDIVLTPAPVRMVTGRIVEGRFNPLSATAPIATETPVAGAGVDLTQAGSMPSDADGRFEFEVVAGPTGETGNKTVLVRKDGYWDVRVNASPAADGNVDFGDVALLKVCSGTIPGGIVVDQVGNPVEGATVTVTGESARPVTGPDGRFEIGAVDLSRGNRARTVSVSAVPPGGPEWVGATSERDVVTLSRCGETTSSLEVRLVRAATTVERFGSVVGRVTLGDPFTLEDTGVPVTGLNVGVLGVPGAADSTDADGRFVIEDVLVGESFVDDPTPISAGKELTVSPGGDFYPPNTDFGLVSESTVNVDFVVFPVVFGAIEGRVVDRVTGEPLAGAPVSATSQLTTRRTTTDADGRYVFEELPAYLGFAPREYDVTAVAQDPDGIRSWWRLVESVDVVATQTAVQDMRLLQVCRGGSVSGLVVEAGTLAPLEDVMIRIGNQRTMTAADGTFLVEDVPVARDNGSNDVIVYASKEGFFDSDIGITVFCESMTVVDFGSPSTLTGTIVGTVTEEGGQPVAGAFIGSEFGGSTVTDVDGTYRLDSVPLRPDDSPRSWTVTVLADDRRAEQSVQVASRPDAVADFVLPVETTPTPTTTTTPATVPPSATTPPTTTPPTTTTTPTTTTPASTAPPASTIVTTLPESSTVPPTAVVHRDGSDDPVPSGSSSMEMLGTEVVLDASKSRPGTAETLSFEWTLVVTPVASSGALLDGQQIFTTEDVRIDVDQSATVAVSLRVSDADDPTMFDEFSTTLVFDADVIDGASPPATEAPTATVAPPPPDEIVPVGGLPSTGSRAGPTVLIALLFLLLGGLLIGLRRRPSWRVPQV